MSSEKNDSVMHGLRLVEPVTTQPCLLEKNPLLAVLSRILCVLALGSFSAFVFAQGSLLECAGLESDAERLACYDRIVDASGTAADESLVEVTVPAGETAAGRGRTPEEEVSGNESIVMPGSESQAAAGKNSAVGNPDDDFGFENGRRSIVEERPEEPESREIVVASATHNRLTGWRIETEGGQVWQQIGTEDYRIREGERYEIIKGFFNSFQLGNASSNRKIRVRREQ